MSPTITIGIDPGVNCTGWAVARAGCIYWLGILRMEPELLLPQRCVEVYRWCRNVLLSENPDGIAVELPRSYPGPRQAGDQNDLLDLATIAGAAASAFRIAPVKFVYPRQWAGTVPKEVRHERLRASGKINWRLVEAIKPASLRHNALDACGIALWAQENATCLHRM